MKHPFFSLPEADRRAAADAACKAYGVESLYDLDPQDRLKVYNEAVAEFDRGMRLSRS